VLHTVATGLVQQWRTLVTCKHVSFHHVPRHKNAEADRLAKLAVNADHPYRRTPNLYYPLGLKATSKVKLGRDADDDDDDDDDDGDDDILYGREITGTNDLQWFERTPFMVDASLVSENQLRTLVDYDVIRRGAHVGISCTSSDRTSSTSGKRTTGDPNATSMTVLGALRDSLNVTVNSWGEGKGARYRRRFGRSGDHILAVSSVLVVLNLPVPIHISSQDSSGKRLMSYRTSFDGLNIPFRSGYYRGTKPVLFLDVERRLASSLGAANIQPVTCCDRCAVAAAADYQWPGVPEAGVEFRSFGETPICACIDHPNHCICSSTLNYSRLYHGPSAYRTVVVTDGALHRFCGEQRTAIQKYYEAGGRVVVLGSEGLDAIGTDLRELFGCEWDGCGCAKECFQLTSAGAAALGGTPGDIALGYAKVHFLKVPEGEALLVPFSYDLEEGVTVHGARRQPGWEPTETGVTPVAVHHGRRGQLVWLGFVNPSWGYDGNSGHGDLREKQKGRNEPNRITTKLILDEAMIGHRVYSACNCKHCQVDSDLGHRAQQSRVAAYCGYAQY
jgi:hypothetical protein